MSHRVEESYHVSNINSIIFSLVILVVISFAFCNTQYIFFRESLNGLLITTSNDWKKRVNSPSINDKYLLFVLKVSKISCVI